MRGDGLIGHPPLRIEFFGLPGSGKTTIARALHGLMTRHDPSCRFSPDVTQDQRPGLPRTLARLRLIARNAPLRAADRQAVAAILRLPQRRRKDAVKALFNHLTVAALYRDLERQGASAIVDQGLLQAIWSVEIMATGGFEIERWKPLLRKELSPQRFHICIQTPPAVCQGRLDARPGKHSRMQSDTVRADPVLWERAESIRAGVTVALASACGQRGLEAQLLAVDGTQDPTAAAIGIMEHIFMTPFVRTEDVAAG